MKNSEDKIIAYDVGNKCAFVNACFRVVSTACAGGVMSAACLSAQTWQTVDNFQYSPGTNAYATGLAKDPTGTIIYSVGDAQDATGAYHAVAFKSSDGGTTWALMDDYAEGASPPYYGPGYDAGIAVDASGNIYCSGDNYLASGDSTWFTRRSTDGGLTWSTVDTLSFGTPGTLPFALSTDTAGNVYVVGEVQTNAQASGYVSIVRKGIGGTNWSTVAQSGSQTNYPSWRANGIYCHPTAGIFTVGTGTTALKSAKVYNYYQVWTVRRSQDGGATWTPVDTYYQLKGSQLYAGSAAGIGADRAGNIYVFGSQEEPTSNPNALYSHWLTRRSVDGGNTWSTVDDYVPTNLSTITGAKAFGADAHGNLFVVGSSGSPSSVQWVVRENLGGSGNWQTVDTFQYVSGQESDPTAVVGDSSGSIFVAGRGYDSSRVFHWLVRKN